MKYKGSLNLSQKKEEPYGIGEVTAM